MPPNARPPADDAVGALRHRFARALTDREPSTLGYLDLDVQSVARGVLRVSAEPDLLPLYTRNFLMAASDIVRGMLIVAFVLLSVSRRHVLG